MNLDINEIIDALASHAAASGYFGQVNRHEARSSPQNDLVAALWFERLAPLRARSGLVATSALVVLQMRLYQSMQLEPRDMIDPRMVEAASALVSSYSGDFELGGHATHVDLLGQHGDGLEVRAGYVELDGSMVRVLDLTIPLVVDDVWTQAP